MRDRHESGGRATLTHLYELIQQRAEAFPSAIALGGEQGLAWRTLTSRQMLDLVDRLAEELAAEGVQEGDRVVLWAPNHWRTPIYHFALWKLGAVVVPFDREMNPEAGARILESVEPRCIVAGYGERPSWAQSDPISEWWEPGSRRRTAHGELILRQAQDERNPNPLILSLSKHEPREAGWTKPTEELAAIMFTSGTTGTPKGCMITHAGLCFEVEALHGTIALDTTSRLASILPLSHLFELTVGLLYPLSCGAAIHYIPSRRGPDIVRVLSEQRITHMLAVPQLLTMMGQALDGQLQASLPSSIYRCLDATAPHLSLAGRRLLFWMVHRKLGGQLRVLASGGAALPAETQALWERMGVRVEQGYGTTECSPVIACGLGDGSTPAGSVGRPLPGVEVRLSPEGELLVKGPNVMHGYWRDPERSAEVVKDGWYATGDLVTIDGDGCIRLAGRAKDLIVLPSGMNVWPEDVEDVLRQDAAVKDAAVLAVPAAAGGATLHAYLLPANAQARTADPAAIVSRANARLAQHQRVGTASWWPDADFPRTAIGKVKRNLLPLPDSVRTVKVEAVLAADDPAGQAIAGAARVNAVQKDQTLGELGLDSLGLVELALALEEKTGKLVNDSDLSTEMTVEQVRSLLLSAPSADGEAQGGSRGYRGAVSAEQPRWPYTWGRIFRVLSLPVDVLYRLAITNTVVLGGENLQGLPANVIFAGTHHSFADLPLIRFGLSKTPARRLDRRLVIAASSVGWEKEDAYSMYGRLAFGLYPLQQYGDRDASLRGLARLVLAGNAVLIFPQGHHSSPERERAGDLAEGFHPGVAHLAAALEAAVVPFGIAGTEKVIPPSLEGFHGRTIAGVPVSIRRLPLAIAFGPPLTYQPDESPQAFTSRLQEASFALTRQAERALDDNMHRV